MKLELYKKQEPTEPVIRIATKNENGEITMFVVDEAGNKASAGLLLKLKNTGELYLYPCVGHALGFQRDGQGCVKLADSE